ncbi:MAG: hypothetical protein L0211_11485 [Planctomycetaceae bacterium]|nr:hypothetical protein [Planctomycetaceae bacterium]
MNGKLAVITLFLGLLVAEGSALAADKERNPKPDPNSLGMMVERIRGHASKDEWREAGWSDPTLEKWLETTVAALGALDGKGDYKLPVKMAEARAADPMAFRRPGEGTSLVVGTNVKLTHCDRYFVLADGNAEVSFARNCVIVARGVVSISHCSNSVVVSGTAVEIGHENGLRDAGPGSMVLCRGRVDIAHSRGTFILAHEGATVSHANGTTFVGPEPKTSHRDATCKVIKSPLGFPVEPRPADPLESKIEVLGAVKPRGLVFRFAGKRYVADLAEPIVDESGLAVAALAAWKVTFVGDEFAALSNGRVDVPLKLPSGE